MFPGGKIPGEDYIFSWYTIFVALSFGMVIGLRNYMRGPQCMSQEKLEKKIAIVTGANTGIGLEIAKDLALRGARVILGCRDEEKGKAAVEEVIEYAKSKRVRFIKLDLSSFQSIRDFVTEFQSSNKSLHYLVNNAAVMYHPEGSSADGHEIHFATNYLGHFLLTHLLMDMMKASAPGRIVNFTCPAYQLATLDLDALDEGKEAATAAEAFAQSKLAVMLSTRELARKLEGSNVTANVVHPGLCNSFLYRNMPFMQSKVISYTFKPVLWFLMKGMKDGAQTAIQCLVAKEEEGVTGKYYADCLIKPCEEKATDDEVAARLWTITEKLVDVNVGAVTDAKSN